MVATCEKVIQALRESGVTNGVEKENKEKVEGVNECFHVYECSKQVQYEQGDESFHGYKLAEEEALACATSGVKVQIPLWN